MSFDPSHCRNESEVESKLIVSYLLPKLGYSPDSWYQEVALGSIRLDFLVFATQVLPFGVSSNSPLSIILEAKSPTQNLDKHVPKFRRYLTSLNVLYGLLTNGKEIRIYQRVLKDIQLIFTCQGHEVEEKFQEIKAILGKDSLTETTQIKVIKPSTVNQESNMKVIAIYHNKGGVGKTTTVVNLAAALSKKGKKVLVIDLDSQANTTFATGLVKFDDEEDDDLKDCNILHVLQSEELFPIKEVARKSQFCNPDLDVVPAHIDLMQYENELNQLDYSRMILIQKLADIKNKYDIVIIDTPPSLNLYARIALIAADYLIIPSDLKPFANQGLINVKDFIKKINTFRKQIGRSDIQIIGVLACKISTNSKFIQYTLPQRIKVISQRYSIPLMDTVIYERDDLAKCAEQSQIVGNLEIADPRSVLDYKPDSLAAQEFEILALEVLQKIGMDL